MKSGYYGTYDFVGRYRKPRTSRNRGVRLMREKDGRGRWHVFWIAAIRAGGVVRTAKFSVRKYGAQARELAFKLRQVWQLELLDNSTLNK